MTRWLVELFTAAFGAVCRRMFFLLGKDITKQTEPRSCLVLAPHPDDEVLGCGATIMRKLDAGARVEVVFVTDGRHSHASRVIGPDELAKIRRHEALAACRVLGLGPEDLHFLDVEDGSVRVCAEPVAARIAEIARTAAPQELFVPSAYDGHDDHRALNEITRRLVGDGVVGAEVHEYPVWFWSRKSWVRARTSSRILALVQIVWRPPMVLPRLKPRLVRTSGYLDRERQALAAYRSQVFNLTDEPTWLTLDEGFLRNFFQRYELFFASDQPERLTAEA